MSTGNEGIYASLIETHRTLPLLALVTNVGVIVVKGNSSQWCWISKDVNLVEHIVSVEFSQPTSPLALAVITNDKRLLIFECRQDKSEDSWVLQQTRLLRKRPCAVVFPSDSEILIADKSGLVQTLSLSEKNQASTVLEAKTENEKDSSDDEEVEEDSCLGHYATIVAMTMSLNGKYVVTGDRDNKIRISNYPQTYLIHSFCLSDPSFFVTRIWTLELDKEWLFSVHHNSEMKVWDWSGICKFRHIHSTMDFLVDASAHVYDIHTVWVASIAYSCNYSWLWIVKYDSLENEFRLVGEVKLELPDIPCCVRFDKEGQLWFSFLKQDVGIRKVTIDYAEVLCDMKHNSILSLTMEKTKWETFQLTSIPNTSATVSSVNIPKAELLWNRPKMLHDMRKKEYVSDWKGKKLRTTYNI